MAILQLDINTNDEQIIEQLKINMVKADFFNNVQIRNIKVITTIKKNNEKPKTKWAEFAEKMDGLFTPEIIEHINLSRKEARDNFIVNV